MKTQCPECKTIQTVPDIYAGKKVKCPSCKKPFTAQKYEDIVLAAQKPVESLPPMPSLSSLPNGTWLNVLGILFIIFSVLFNFFYNKNLGYESAINHVWGGNNSYSEAEIFLIKTIISGITFIGILFGFIFISVGSLIRAINANTSRKEISKKS